MSVCEELGGGGGVRRKNICRIPIGTSKSSVIEESPPVASEKARGWGVRRNSVIVSVSEGGGGGGGEREFENLILPGL